ncbi:MAG: hypothetical protein HYU41_12925 [Candidatus Rokubacteria bacterium]|nr:hypothetical protein [Candidatus Rokubacteria bacterium]
MSPPPLRAAVGITAILSCALYLAADAWEIASGQFLLVQLWLTYAAFVAVPFFMLGLHALQGSRGGVASLTGAVAYGVAFVFYAGTALYAVVSGTEDYATLVRELGLAYPLHGVLTIGGAVLFGWSVARAGVFPRWTGIVLAVGGALALLLFAAGAPPIAQVAGNTLRNVAFIGMAIAALRAR